MTHDHDLINRIILGEQETLTLLYDRYASVLYRIISHHYKDQIIIEKTLSEVFKEIWKNPRQFQNKKHISKAILIICHNKVKKTTLMTLLEV